VYIYSGNFLKVPLGFGFHYYYYSGEHWDNDGVMQNPGDWYKYSDHQMGVGFYLGTQFHFNRNLYIAARTTVSYDVFHFSSASGNVNGAETSESKTGMISGLGVKPAIGLGIKF
jgi:hypothetical protein